MKFQSVLDVQTFLTEIGSISRLGESLDPSYEPTHEEIQSFIKKRSAYVSKMKDYRRSSAQKSNWRENRTKMMKGIRAFHKSVEGKRFHRKLGRFLASRITRKKNESHGYNGFLEQVEYLVGLNSVKQHLFVEMDYFHQAQEQIELEEMILEYAIPLLRSIEEKIIKSVSLTEDEMTFLLDLTDEQDVLHGLSEMAEKPLSLVADFVRSQSEALVQEGIAKANESFYPGLVARLCAFDWETL